MTIWPLGLGEGVCAGRGVSQLRHLVWAGRQCVYSEIVGMYIRRGLSLISSLDRFAEALEYRYELWVHLG